jgi:predicted methyltransferase
VEKFRSGLAALAASSAPVFLALACRSAQTNEPSLHPGINEPYLARDIDIAEWTARFEREGRSVYDRRDEIISLAAIAPGSVVADIGAGTGLFVPLLAAATGPKGRVIAVDIVPQFLEHIEQRAREQGLANVEVALCSERSVGLPERSIDVAFLCDVYHHFEFPQSTLASIRSALRPGGELILIDFERIPGESAEWVMDHVRAGKAEVIRELGAAGFAHVEELELGPADTFFLRFARP